MLATARQHEAIVTAYAPLAMGRVRDDPLLARIGATHGKTPVQVALRWLVEQAGVAAIPKASNATHAQENFDIFDFALTSAESGAIGRLARGDRLIQPELGPVWDS